MKSVGPTISVVLPTFNRVRLLDQAIGSIARLRMPPSTELELIVVDNNSTDSTPLLIECAAQNFPFRLVYIKEMRQGVSYARNAGINKAHGDYIVLMDDDQAIDADYVEVALETFRKYSADCIGGWLGYEGIDDFPDWLKTIVVRMGQRDLGPEVLTLTATGGRLAGGNMAFTRATLDRIGAYRTDLGRVKDSGLDGEDLEIQDRLLSLGGKIIYDPRLRQTHYLEPERRRRFYYLFRAFNSGRGEYRMTHDRWQRSRKICGIPVGIGWRIARAIIGAVFSIAGSSSKRFNACCSVAAHLGEATEAIAIWRAGRLYEASA